MITFTNRSGGLSAGKFNSLNLGDHVGDEPAAVLANRALVAQRYGSTQYMNQVHGSRVAIIEEVTLASSAEIPRADALVTGIAGITLAVLVADCIPLILTSADAVAAVHVGRRGLINSVTARTIEIMREIGTSEISATIGPAICGICYEVSQAIFSEVVSSHPNAASRTLSGSPALDLVQALIADLHILDVVKIDNQSRCTFQNQDLFSYRRDGLTGRQAGLVSL